MDLRARFYDPTTEQYTSRDTYLGTATNPLSLNLYSYGANDPTQLSDPSGHDPLGSAFGGLAVVGCGMGGLGWATNLFTPQMLASLAIGFIPGIGDAYFLLSAVAGQDLFTGTHLTQPERVVYGSLAAFSLATLIVGSGIFSQEARYLTPLM